MDDTLPMDQTARPDLVTERRIEEPEREPEPVVEQPPANIDVDEKETSRPRDEHGRFTKAEETGEKQPEPAAEPPSASVPLKALEDERRKRQEMEQELAAIRQQMQQTPPPSMWEDEQGWQQHFSHQVVSEASFNAHLNMSEMLARRDHADFDEIKAEFLEMANANPALGQQALASPDPWNEAYRIAKNARTLKEVGAHDLDGLKATWRAEWEAEVKAKAPPMPSFPQSTVHDGTVAPRGAAIPQSGDVTLPMDRTYR